MAQTVPLQLLASEWQIAPDVLADEFGAKIIVDQLEIRHVTITDAQAVLAKHRAEPKAREETEAAYREQLAAMQQPVFAHVQAIQAKQHAQRAAGDIDADTPALVAMTVGDPNSRLEAAGRRFDDMLNAGRAGNVGTMYRFNPNQEAQS